MRLQALLLMAVLLISSGCFSGQGPDREPPSRESGIPADAAKMLPADDIYPPVMHSGLWEEPVPLEGPVNSAGAEDSAFMAPDGTLYFFFTPDARVPAEKQLFDNLTGIYESRRTASGWSEPVRVMLAEPGKLALDGCGFVQGDEMWFCSAREGHSGVGLFTARRQDGKWTGIEQVEQALKYHEVGEMHLSADGAMLYFHSPRAGGKGGYDIWTTEKVAGEWQEPIGIEAVNTGETEGWPYLTEDGNELWFTRVYLGSPAVFRSVKTDGVWGEPELIISQFAGEPTLDSDGNIYFTHHFYREGQMIEADIYVAYKK